MGQWAREHPELCETGEGWLDAHPDLADTAERPVDEQVHFLHPPTTDCPECDGDGDIIVTCPCCSGSRKVPA